MGQFEYEDIIGIKYPFEGEHKSTRVKMDRQNRAKIFAPFAALRGHADELKERQYDEYDECDYFVPEEL